MLSRAGRPHRFAAEAQLQVGSRLAQAGGNAPRLGLPTPLIRPSPPPPEGFRYIPEIIDEGEEESLLGIITGLQFQPFEFQGYLAKRRVVEYGYEYDFSSRKAAPAAPIPEFLFPLRDRAAAHAGVASLDFVEAVITEYPAGAQLGWHRDVPQFEKIFGLSLKNPCRFRFKPYRAEGKIASVILEPRSAYVIEGAARWKFQHSIPPMKEQRYSITFRTLRTPPLK